MTASVRISKDTDSKQRGSQKSDVKLGVRASCERQPAGRGGMASRQTQPFPPFFVCVGLQQSPVLYRSHLSYSGVTLSPTCYFSQLAVSTTCYFSLLAAPLLPVSLVAVPPACHFPPCWFSAGCSSPCYSSPLQLLPLAVPPFATPLLGANPRVLSTSRSSKVVLYLKAQFTLICTLIILTTRG